MEGPGGGGGKLSSEGAGLLASPANDMQEQVEGACRCGRRGVGPRRVNGRASCSLPEEEESRQGRRRKSGLRLPINRNQFATKCD